MNADYIVSGNGRRYATFARLTDALEYAQFRCDKSDADTEWMVESRPRDGGQVIATVSKQGRRMTPVGLFMIENGAS